MFLFMVVTFYRRHSDFHSPNAFFVPKRSCLFLVRQPLSYKDAQGKRKTKWIPTGYLIRGNKKKAEAFLMEQRQTFQLPAEDTEAVEKGELFAEYLEHWLKIAKSTMRLRRTALTTG